MTVINLVQKWLQFSYCTNLKNDKEPDSLMDTCLLQTDKTSDTELDEILGFNTLITSTDTEIVTLLN